MNVSLKLTDGRGGLEAHAGEVILLTGDVGCGKSVWLKRLAGLLDFPKGVRMDMQESAPVVRMQFDRWPAIWLGGTVEEELLFGLKKTLSEQQLEGALLAWHLPEVSLMAEPQSLDRHQSICLSLAAIALAKPSLLLLDNPSAALPEQMAKALSEDIAAWAKLSNTIVVVASNRWHDWRTVVAQTWCVSAPDSLPHLTDRQE
ncbi:MAG: ATP-binding cassette domain-containing protein [Mariprofundus sp.]|nr:ATP-binding cassette domain-containing protein [Mariprofundus sp.]